MSRVWLILALLTLLLSGNWSVSEAQAVNLQLEPRSVQAGVGADFNIAVRIENVEDLGFYQFDVTFDPAVLQVKEVALGDFLASTGRSASGVGPLIDNQAGSMTYGGFSFGAQQGPNGDGVLAEVTFTGAADGVSTVRLGNVKVMDTDNVGLPAVPVGEAVVTIGNPAPIPNTATPTPSSGSTPPAGSTATPALPAGSPTSQPTVAPGATSTVPATAQPILTVTPGVTPTAGVAPTLTATGLGEPTAVTTATAEPGAGSSPSATSTLVASGEVTEPSPTAAAVAATSETPVAGAVETAPETPGAVSTASSPTSPAPLPSLAATSDKRQPPASQSQSPRWLLGVGVGALALAGLLAVVLVVYVVLQRKNT